MGAVCSVSNSSYVDLRDKLGPDNLDRDLSATLTDELPGILAWIIEGAVTCYAEGQRPPEIVRVATDSYGREVDAVGQWLAEFCERGSFRTSFKTLFNAYTAEAGAEALSKRSFAQELDRLAIHDQAVGGCVFHFGARLRSDTVHDA